MSCGFTHWVLECGFTLKLVRDMIITYSQMHRTYNYWQRCSIIWPVRLNVRLRTKWLWVRILLLSLKLQMWLLLRARSSFRQTIECVFTLKLVKWHDNIIQVNVCWIRDLCNLKNVKNTNGGVFLLVKLQASAGHYGLVWKKLIIQSQWVVKYN